jgi:hypothetical protein
MMTGWLFGGCRTCGQPNAPWHDCRIHSSARPRSAHRHDRQAARLTARLEHGTRRSLPARAVFSARVRWRRARLR